MTDLSLILKDKRNYKNLKSNIKTIINYLNNAIENLDVPSSRINSYYSVDSVGIDRGKINLVKQELIKKRNYLKNIVLVELNKELQEIEDNIEGM